MKRVLVTGASGFIGRALCTRMVDDGWKVRGTVRYAEQAVGLPAGVDAAQVQSISETTDWSKALANIEMVIHLAARVHMMKDNATDPLTAYREVNLIGTEHLARMAANIGVKRFIYMSSVKVLGDGKPFPYTERDTPAPEDPYGISKWEAEQAINKVAAETELKAVVLRAPLVYGPQVKANYLNLLKLVKRGLPLPVGAINNRRSMIYIGNMVNTIITCLEHPAATGETFIVSDGNDVSTPQLICMIASAMGKDPRLLSFPPSLLKLLGKVAGKSAEVERLTGSLCVDISKIRRTLNWKPPFSMEEGIRETVNWFMEQT